MFSYTKGVALHLLIQMASMADQRESGDPGLSVESALEK